MNNKAVIFDMDGTMLNNGEYHDKAWAIFCDKYGFARMDLKTHFGKVNKEFMKGLFGEHITEEEIKTYATEKENIYQTLIKDEIKPIAGLHAFLDALRSKQIPLAIGTAAPLMNVDFTLETFGLQGYFDVIVHDGMIAHGKPHPEVFLKVAQELGISPANCVVIEDSLHGFKATHAAGMKLVAIATTLSRDEINGADMVIDSFLDVDVDKFLNL